MWISEIVINVMKFEIDFTRSPIVLGAISPVHELLNI